MVTAVHDEDRELEVDLGRWKAGIVLRGEEDERFNPPDAKGNIKRPSERFKVGSVISVVAAPPGAARPSTPSAASRSRPAPRARWS